MVAVTELVDRLNMIRLLDAAIGPIKVRDRGHSGGQLLVGLAAAQLAGEDFLVGLDRHPSTRTRVYRRIASPKMLRSPSRVSLCLHRAGGEAPVAGGPGSFIL